jgi:hypothetical protein
MCFLCDKTVITSDYTTLDEWVTVNDDVRVVPWQLPEGTEENNE